MKINLDTIFGAMDDLDSAAETLDRDFSKPKSLMRVCSTIIKNGKSLQRHPDRSLKRLAKSVTDGAGELQAIIKGFKGKYDDTWPDLEEYESLVEWLIEEIYSLNTELEQIAQEMDEEKKPLKTFTQFMNEAGSSNAVAYVRNPYNDRTSVFNLIWNDGRTRDVALHMSAGNGKEIYDYLKKNGIKKVDVKVNTKNAKEHLKALDYVKKKGIKITIKEGVEITEKRMGKKDYEIYHRLYSDAVHAAVDLAQRNGYEVSEDDFFNQVTVGPRKPSKGQTNSFKVQLLKGGKEVRRMLVFQIYGMDSGNYELTAYIS